MRNSFVLLLAISSVLLFGCTKTSPVSPNINNLGGITFELDKSTAPQEVAAVAAYLSRSGFDTLSSVLNLLSDSTAGITMENIPTGKWHLTVEAMNSSGMTVYSGETDVDVEAGVTTQVNLTLMPSTGIINITVNWGTGLSFADYGSNPVFTASQNPASPLGVAEAKVIVSDGIYRMWYLATFYPRLPSIWYAISSDGISWTNQTSSPVLNTDDSTSWDCGYYIACGGVIKDGSTFKMYYNAIQSPYGKSSTGLATSSDGITWEKYATPVLTGDSAHYHIGTISVVKSGSTYFLYYNSSPVNNYNSWTINAATSTDGVHWTSYSGNPILAPTFSWEGGGVTYPSVIIDGGQFVMLYESTDRTNYGLAYSSNGLNWTKRSGDPVFSTAQTKQSWIQIDYPCLVSTGSGYRVYYTGVDASDHLNISFTSTPALR
ncbi:MAG TPA: hypothetical protein VIS48_14545 [Candidatus Kryptonia bacterium]